LRVRKAVFPAAGWGTRLLPATKALPKEMLPLVDKPVIQYSIEEAVAAGIEHVVVVTSSQKRPIEDHFDHNYELEQLLEEKGDIDNLRTIRQVGDLVQISYVRQKEQLGLGHAVLMAKEAIGHEPFAVMLPDDVMVGDRPCIGQLIDAYNRTHGSVVAVMEVPDSEVSRYGVIDPDSDADTNDERLHKVQRLVEKPDAGSAPSNLAIIGRYVLTPKIFEKLESTPRGAGGEIQLTDAIGSLISDEQDVYAYAFEGKRYDAGTTMGWLEASVELALERPDIGGEFRRFLSGLDLS
jgi:UTP--glucose-1-phosphate uridylyltransferase